MPIDSNIAMGVQNPQFNSPLNALAQVLQIRQFQNQGDMADLNMQQTRQGIEETNALKRLLGSEGFDINKPEYQRQVMGISPKAGQELIKGNLEGQKTGAEISSKRAETATKKAGMFRDALSNVSSPQQAAMWLQAQYQDADLKGIFPVPYEQAVQNIPQDQAGFQQWLQKQSLGMGKFIEQNAPKTNVVNTGGSTQIVQTPGLGGAPVVAGTLQNTQSPDARERLAQDKENAAQGVTYQTDENGQIVALPTKLAAGAPAVGRVAVGPDGAALVSGAKPLTDAQAKAALFGTRMQEANKIFDTLEKSGTTTSIPGSRAGMGIGAVISALSPSAQQQLDQAKRDFVNAVLRRESGAVIADSEFANAEKQYFPQVGDTPDVIAQKRRNREIAQRGIMAEVPQGKRASLSAEITGQPQSGAFADPAKESRYQQWKASQGK